VNDFDRFVKDLQRQIDEQERALYSAQVRKHARNPQNIGALEPADGFASISGPCGDTMEIYLRMDRWGRIRQVSFLTDGCGPTLACGSMISVLAKGLTPEKALLISADGLLQALGGLPPESIHCAELAVNTLRSAVRDLPKV
jgi:nitrogen fixation NifU-like protein